MSITGIIETVTEDSFIRAFDRMNRGDNFSVAGRRALFEYYEGLSEDQGEPIELDVIQICCAHSEYSSIEDIVQECFNWEEVEAWLQEEHDVGIEEADWDMIHEYITDHHDYIILQVWTFDTSSPKASEWKDVQTGVILEGY